MSSKSHRDNKQNALCRCSPHMKKKKNNPPPQKNNPKQKEILLRAVQGKYCW